MSENRQVVLRRRPDGLPSEDDFAVRTSPLPVPGAGEVLVRTVCVSVDPAMRGWLIDGPNYFPPVGLGDPMRSFGIGRVEQSRNPEYREGDLVVGMTGWQDWAALGAADIHRRIDPDLSPLSASLGVLGLTGLTAYVGMLEIGRPAAGETVLVSTAAGAVGSIAGQLAAAAGARVVGLTGSLEKQRLCTEYFGFAAAINYRSEPDLSAAIGRECPDGVDVYFDSVGGSVLDAALEHLTVGARVPVCGTIGIPPGTTPSGHRIERQIVVRRLLVQGFLATDHFDRLDVVAADLADRLAAGSLRHLEDISPRLEDAPAALVRQLAGQNLGRSIVQVEPQLQPALAPSLPS